MYKRRLQKIISNIYDSDKNIIITGARQTGKSTLLEVLLADSLYKDNFTYISFDNPDTREFFSSNAVEKLSTENKKVLILDEVQKFPQIFDSIKVLIDKNKEKHHFLTGSSQLILLKSVQESLAGRVSLFAMYPLAFSELFDDRTEIFLDIGLLRTLLKNTERDLTGKEYETWVFSELVKWQSVKNIQPELYYYRTAAGLEIDFIIKYKNKILPIEVKMKEKINNIDIKSLKLFIKQYNIDFGIVV